VRTISVHLHWLSFYPLNMTGKFYASCPTLNFSHHKTKKVPRPEIGQQRPVTKQGHLPQRQEEEGDQAVEVGEVGEVEAEAEAEAEAVPRCANDLIFLIRANFAAEQRPSNSCYPSRRTRPVYSTTI
jgi:hypothetical protein